MPTSKKRTSTKKVTRKGRISTTRPTKAELERVIKKALEQYHIAVKNLAHR